MIQRFLLDWIDTKPTASAVGGQHHPIAHALSNETESALSVVQFTKPRTKPALNAPVGQDHPPAPGIIGLLKLCDHS
jgi:hypothetical protein